MIFIFVLFVCLIIIICLLLVMNRKRYKKIKVDCTVITLPKNKDTRLKNFLDRKSVV